MEWGPSVGGWRAPTNFWIRAASLLGVEPDLIDGEVEGDSSWNLELDAGQLRGVELGLDSPAFLEQASEGDHDLAPVWSHGDELAGIFAALSSCLERGRWEQVPPDSVTTPRLETDCSGSAGVERPIVLEASKAPWIPGSPSIARLLRSKLIPAPRLKAFARRRCAVAFRTRHPRSA